MTKVKICGLRTARDIEYANILMPEYVGFIFVKGRRRYVSPDEAKALRSQLREGISAVGVFLDEPPEKVLSIAESTDMDIIQLHGNEDENYITSIQKLMGKPVIKAFTVGLQSDFDRIMNSPADFLLLDSGTGTGKVFDWALLPKIARPFFLAGGLSPENAYEAVEHFSPFALDVSSGVETDGSKDFEKMKKFIEAVRKI